MKKYIFPFLIITLFISCKSKTNTPAKDSIAKASPSVNKTEALIKRFKPIIQGVWVRGDYIDKIIKTKSPLAATDLAGGLTTFIIETDKIKGDSSIVAVGWGNHEGGELTLKFKPGKINGTILLGERDLEYVIKAGDTLITLHYFDKEKKLNEVTTYKKAFNRKPDDLGQGTQYLIDKGIVSGKYTAIDTLGTQSYVVLTDNGKVNGLANFKTYFINDDLLSDPMDNLDEIIFDLFNKPSKSFTFKIKTDTLNLYNTYPNADSTELMVGKLVYKLVRMK